MKKVHVALVAGAVAAAIMVGMSNQTPEPAVQQISHTPNAPVPMLVESRFDAVFPQGVTRLKNGDIALTEDNRRRYTEHFRLPDDTPWSRVQDESINRVLERAGQ